jgi:L-seryl-tRNA(Ser) seleniumtransferase
MVDTAIERGVSTTGVYERMGLRTIINGGGSITLAGGSLMRPEVMAAMAEASRAFIVVEELNAKVGERIAEVTGAEAGCVTAGSAAGMAIAAAACIAGTDPERVARLPGSTGLANEIVLHRAHRISYDQSYRVGGAKLVEIGIPYATQAWELERAITERTAAVAWHDTPNVGTGALPFETVVEIAHSRGVPVIVDAASTLPPVDHLRRWIRWGADLVIYSGGKGIRGPQDSGLLAGRKDLIEAARLQGTPFAAVGRGMKISKEAMVGLWVALELFLEADHEADFQAHKAQIDTIAAGLAGRADCRFEINANPRDWPAPIMRLWAVDNAWSPQTVQRALLAGTPRIQLVAEFGGLLIHTHCLQPGEEEIVIRRLLEELDRQQ